MLRPNGLALLVSSHYCPCGLKALRRLLGGLSVAAIQLSLHIFLLTDTFVFKLLLLFKISYQICSDLNVYNLQARRFKQFNSSDEGRNKIPPTGAL